MQERMKELERKLVEKESKSSVETTSRKEPVKTESSEVKSPTDEAPSRKVIYYMDFELNFLNCLHKHIRWSWLSSYLIGFGSEGWVFEHCKA